MEGKTLVPWQGTSGAPTMFHVCMFCAPDMHAGTVTQRIAYWQPTAQGRITSTFGDLIGELQVLHERAVFLLTGLMGASGQYVLVCNFILPASSAGATPYGASRVLFR